MKDNEIIKVLECCKGYLTDDCIECPYVEKYPQCTTNLREAALDLITRQKAECERLGKELNEYPVKTLVGNNCVIHSKSIEDYDNLIADIGNEAIKEFCLIYKEFAERLKSRLRFYCQKRNDGAEK